MKRITDPAVQPFETEHINAVRALAPECTVLLKNEGILPLKGAGKIALYGSGARRTIKGGTGSGDVNVRHFVTVEEGLKNAGFTITSGAWLDGYEEVMQNARKVWIQELKDLAKESGQNIMMMSMGAVMPEPDYELPLDAEGDTAVYVLSRISGEGSDRNPVAGDIDLSETEIRDIRALNAKYETFILVLNVGGMVNLAPVADVKCILLLGQLGTPTGDVCADLLLGKSSPSGKLAMTWAPIADYPSTEGFGDVNDTCYKEGIYVGYRYFDTVGKKPAYPFGYGLSYTTFEITDTGFSVCGADVSVTAAVKNTGERAGKEVVQVYVSAAQGSLDRPYQELKGYAKTAELAPGETETLGICFDLKDAAGYSEEKAAWILEKGDYTVRVGNCSANTKPVGIIRLDETIVTKQVTNVFGECGFADFMPVAPAADAQTDAQADNPANSPADNPKDTPADIPVIAVKAADLDVQPAAACKDTARADAAHGDAAHADAAHEDAACEGAAHTGAAHEDVALADTAATGERIDWREVKAGNKTIDDFLAGLTNTELADICIGYYADGDGLGSIIGAGSILLAGGAGDTTHRVKGLDALSMADGPAGIRMNKEYKVVGGALKPIGNALESVQDFFDEEQLAILASMAGEPSQEEKGAPVNYQYCIAIPIGTGLAQSFNDDLCESLGDLVGDEMELFGVNYWLAPALNIQRNPLCGRNFEYLSEDPYLSGKISAAITKGVQKHKGCGTTIKHFAANNQETNRYGSNSLVSERAMREIYLKGFEIAIEESAPEALMTSYNLINGEHSCNRRDLLTTVLREEWGYKGLVMTDWYITTDMMANPAYAHGPASAAGCVKAGNNVTMPGNQTDAADIRKALDDPTHPYALTRADLIACAKPVLEAVIRLHDARA